MSNKLFFTVLSFLLLAGCSTEGRRLKTESGYEYQIVRKGSSEPILLNSYLLFNMSLIVNDSVWQTTATRGRPSEIQITGDTKSQGHFGPLIELMATLHEGDSLVFYFPVDSFDTKPPVFDTIKGPVEYHVGIAEVLDEAEYKTRADSIRQSMEAAKQIIKDRMTEIEAKVNATYDAYKKGDLKNQMITTESGLRYIIHEEGDGPKPVQGEQISVHYYGMLDSDGKVVDASFSRGQALQFQIGTIEIIQGWNQAFVLMNRGTKATIFIPSALGYGAAGRPPVIPENADLIFYIELEK